ncbi:MAG: site-specific DNA-methyltransferase [Anaerolineales bacterium]|nr:site-specific DNA-methyltransferase [Anaerolineales bacterium]
MINLEREIQAVLEGKQRYGLLWGDCQQVLDNFPAESIDCVITSPPYWKLRDYEIDDDQVDILIGNEDDPKEYVNRLVEMFGKVKRVLKPTGSLWLNIGDKYYNKNLMGMPWRVALGLQDNGWILRNDIVWDQMKGTQSVKDRLRDVYEHIFHFVKQPKYYYDHDKIRIKPEKQPTTNGNGIISATGVSGKKYREQISSSTRLNEQERRAALNALEDTLSKMRRGEIVDFRMTIRGQQRTYHSDSKQVSGRAKEIEDKGFFIMTSHAKGYIPSDIWRIVPEDVWRKDAHYAVFPIELLKTPLEATCPPNGLVLDPFMGTGSTIAAAIHFGNRGLGIEISQKYIQVAEERLKENSIQMSFY